MTESIQPFLDWIRDHPTWSGIIVCLISLSESLAVVGLVVPGVVLMTAIGSMMGAGILPFWETLGWAILGAILGDGISYWLGYHYHEHLKDFWPFKQFPKLLARGEQFFKNHGGKSIIIGRFVGPVRPMIPVIAGMMDMTPRRFLFFNIASAIVWAPLYSLPGILIGASLGKLTPEAASRIGVLILLLLLALWIIYAFLLKIGVWFGTIIWRFVAHTWKSLEASPRLTFIHRFLATKQGTEETQLGLFLLFLLSMGFFIWITCDIYNGTGFLYWNEPIYQLFRALYQNSIVTVFTFISALGNPYLILPFSIPISAWLAWRKQYRLVICWLGTIAIAMLSARLVREFMEMPRPDGLIYSTHSYAFPSGHTLASILFYGMLAGFLHHELTRPFKILLWAVVIPLILLIGFSRVYLGVHWFTDVLGGMTLGLAFVSLGLFIYRRIERKSPAVLDILIPTLISIVLAFALYTVQLYPSDRSQLIRQWPIQELSVQDWWDDKGEKYLLFRSGAIKRHATIFDLQWLGSLDSLKKFLTQHQWIELPALSFNTGLLSLERKTSPNLLPALPRFHRDRLPVLIFSKAIDENKRLVLQIWQSDYFSPNNIPLWVGTLRYETTNKRIPYVTYFKEDSDKNQAKLLEAFSKELEDSLKVRFRIEKVKVSNSESATILRVDSTRP